LLNYYFCFLANNKIFKFDKYLNLTKSISVTTNYRGIYYNVTNELIYVANIYLNKRIDIYSTNLSFVDYISTPFYTPWFITEYNGMLIVSDQSGKNIYFYQNNILIMNLTTICDVTGRVTSILFDNYNHMAILCFSPAYIYLYYTNGTYVGLSIPTCFQPYYMNFDSKGRLITTCQSEINIFY
jgi:hypothetical protein